MEDIRMANRINDFMPYNYGAQMKQVDRTVKQTFPTTLPRTVPRGFISNRPPSLLGTTIVSSDRGKEALMISESTRFRTNAYVNNFGRGETGTSRKKKRKILRDILEEQVRIREAAGIDEIKEIVSRLRKGGFISEAEVLKIEKAGYGKEYITELLKRKSMIGDVTAIELAAQDAFDVVADGIGDEATTNLYIEMIGDAEGDIDEINEILKEFEEQFGEQNWKSLVDYLVYEDLVDPEDVDGLTQSEIDYYKNKYNELISLEEIPAKPSESDISAFINSPHTILEADQSYDRAMSEISSEATMQEDVRNPFEDDRAMGTTLNIAITEAENEIRREIAEEYIAQIPLGANESGYPESKSIEPEKLEAEIERVRELRFSRSEEGVRERASSGEIEIQDVSEEKRQQRTMLRPHGSSARLSTDERLKQLREQYAANQQLELERIKEADRARGEELARQAQARREGREE